ncbi:DUF3575 domain-containing protein [Maribacter sp. 2304DJ31-5]|uniref:DUF3575 domain-containing protein n=1 Tax=Maribacter sp. 2304DJ31-5 TaxID=3386273 RepID=UPI0039BC4FB2
MKILQGTIFLVLLIGSTRTSAQFGKNVEKHQFKINLLFPGLEYEMGVGENSTLNFKAGLQYGLDPNALDPFSQIDLFSAFTAQYRYYHNLERRFRKNKMAYGNSGNYIALATTLFTQSPIKNTVETSPFGAIGPVYGWQRSISAGLSINTELGAGYYLGNFSGGIYPTFTLTLGWIIGEKRWCVGK